MSKTILALVSSLLLVGCAPLTLNIQDPTPTDTVRFDADRIEVSWTAAVEPSRPDPWSSRPIPLPEEVQKQLHEAILRNATAPIVAAGSATEKTVIIQIERAVITETTEAIKGVPFLGMLFLGMKEEYSVIIEGAVEIEDNQGRVIDKAPIRVNLTAQGPSVTATDREVESSKVIEESLLLLHDEIVRNSRRYLHAHLL